MSPPLRPRSATILGLATLALAILPWCPPTCPAADEAPAAQVQTLASRLQHFIDGQVMAGAVMLVADKDRVHRLEAVGFSDLGARTPMRTDSLFWIASMAKPITGAAFMLLVEEGKVALDDPVVKYIPAFNGIRVARPDGTQTPPSHPPTVREVLSHTSGFGFLNKKDQQKIDCVPLATSIEHDLLEPLLADPGTKYNYSNMGIDTAGRIIEIVSGMPYERFLQERLFTPLGMVDTTFNPTAAQLGRLAKSYKTRADKSGLDEVPIHYLTQPLSRTDRFPAPGGGLFSTAADVGRFCQMLAGNGTLQGKRILAAESVRQCVSKQTSPGVTHKYGLGFDTSGDGRSFGHGGAYKTNMRVNDGRVVVFLVQQTNDWSRGDPSREFSQAAAAVPLGGP